MARHFVLQYRVHISINYQAKQPPIFGCLLLLVWYNHIEVNSIHISFKKALVSKLVPNTSIPDFWFSLFLSIHRQNPAYAGLHQTVPSPLICTSFQDKYSLVSPNVSVLCELTPCLPVICYWRFRKTVVLARFRNVCNYLLVDTELTSQETQTFRNTSQRTSGAVVQQQQLKIQFVGFVRDLLFQTQAQYCEGKGAKWQYLKLSRKFSL